VNRITIVLETWEAYRIVTLLPKVNLNLIPLHGNGCIIVSQAFSTKEKKPGKEEVLMKGKCMDDEEATEMKVYNQTKKCISFKNL
jgi:hypothetical protein